MAQQPFDVLRKRVPAPCHMLIGADEKKVALVETEQVRATEPHGFKLHACRARRSLDRAAVDIVDREHREEQAKLVLHGAASLEEDMQPPCARPGCRMLSARTHDRVSVRGRGYYEEEMWEF